MLRARRTPCVQESLIHNRGHSGYSATAAGRGTAPFIKRTGPCYGVAVLVQHQTFMPLCLHLVSGVVAAPGGTPRCAAQNAARSSRCWSADWRPAPTSVGLMHPDFPGRAIAFLPPSGYPSLPAVRQTTLFTVPRLADYVTGTWTRPGSSSGRPGSGQKYGACNGGYPHQAKNGRTM